MVETNLQMNCNSQTPKKQAVRSAAGRIVGEIRGGILRKEVHGSRHLLRSPLGWTWDTSILELAESEGVRITVIRDLDSGFSYRASLSDFRIYGIAIDRGCGPQICLPLKYWTARRPRKNINKVGTQEARI